jgi:2-dehydro-3-deoxyphosphogluconate aldolase/(4S)-4-hydroxy-2-oxoglutarate aldolase
VKVFPCGSIGGPKYLQALRGPFPQIPLVPTGGVTLETAADYIRAGAAALGVGGEMIVKDALKARDRDALSKLATIFVDLVRDARKTSAKP